MKRIQSACIMQTIRFSQKDDAGYSVSQILEMNKAELEKYKTHLERNKTRYVINEENEQSDGSVLILSATANCPHLCLQKYIYQNFCKHFCAVCYSGKYISIRKEYNGRTDVGEYLS